MRKVKEEQALLTIEEKKELMTVDNIRNGVYGIRGQQVMLDYDLTKIYGYEVRSLNEQVKPRTYATSYYTSRIWWMIMMKNVEMTKTS